MEKGHNQFTIITAELQQFRPQLRIATCAPPVVMRGNFINTIFKAGYEGVTITINEKCVHSVNDLLYLKESSDGTKDKSTVKNVDTGKTYQRYGHCSDSMDYLITFAFASEFSSYQRGGNPIIRTFGKNISKNGY